MTFTHASALVSSLALGVACSASPMSQSKPPAPKPPSAAPEPEPAAATPQKTAKADVPKKGGKNKGGKNKGGKNKGAKRTNPEGTQMAKRTNPAADAGAGKRPIPTVEAMREPKKTDAALEAEFKTTFEERLDWGEKARAVVLMSEDWTVERNASTGAIERRTFDVDIAGEKDDGSVMVYDFTMQQLYEGPNRWGTTMRSSHTARGYIDPKNL